MRVQIVCIAGKKGSGKSTLAEGLERRSFARVSFGDFVRSVARRRGISSEVRELELLGQRLISELGWREFCSQVLGQHRHAARVVVDGVRHMDAWNELRSLCSPRDAILVFVEVDEVARASRLLARARPGEQPEDPEMSADVVQLRTEADLVINGAKATAADEVFDWIVLSECT